MPESRKSILVTGGTGYIGSHTAVELVQSGYNCVLLDNLSNSRSDVVSQIQAITGRKIEFYEADCRDKTALLNIMEHHPIHAVIHFAGLKSVGESTEQPLRYYQNNIDSSLVLCEAMREHNIKRLIFSSSATVYGNNPELPYQETSTTGIGITNPYGWTKYMIEQILQDIAWSNPDWRVSILRYFNPIGAHESGLLGENPNGIPNNLMPYIAKVASGELQELKVFGNDYDTPDGTGQRDYVHVVDLARGHVAALQYLSRQSGAYEVFNLGTGLPTSVLELIGTFSEQAGLTIPYKIVDRRPGDVAVSYANPLKANQLLDWHAEKTIADACQDTWRYILNHQAS